MNNGLLAYMANHNEALQLGLFSAKELDVSKSARSNQLRFNNENAANKQEFAKVYSQSLRKQTQGAEHNNSSTHQSKHTAVKSEQSQSSKQRSVNTPHRSNQDRQATETDAAKRGRNLPQNANHGTARQQPVSSDDSTTLANEGAVAQDVASQRCEENHGAENGFENISGEVYRNTEYGLADSTMEPVNLATDSVASEPAQNSVSAIAPIATGVDNVSGITDAVTSSSQPKSAPTLNLESNGSAQGQPILASLSGAAITTPDSPVDNSTVVANTTGDKLAQPTVELTEPLASEQRPKSAATPSALDSLLRSAAEENLIKTPITNAVRLANELNKTSLSTTDVFANLNSGHSGQEGDVEAQKSMRQESALFKDRLFSLTQQHNGQAGNTSTNDLNTLLTQQSAKLSPVLDDQAANDFNINALKEPAVSARLTGNPLHMFSPMLQMSSTLQHRGWSNEVGQRVLWMANTDLQQAQLQLNPKHLGPIEIKITMNADQQINVSFLTHNSAVKDALDQALPRLREVFDQSGLNLNDVNVRQESHKQHHEHHHTDGHGAIKESYMADNMHEEELVAQIFQSRSPSTNIVDYYA